MSNPSLTVILPMHNCERKLRSSVLDILDLAPVVPYTLQVVVVDDGSVDDTYETACELARLFPQLTVFRQPLRRGLSAALDLVRNRLAVETVLAHDGTSSIDAAQLKTLLQSDRIQDWPSAPPLSSGAAGSQSSGSRRFSSVHSSHDRLDQSPRAVGSFCWVQLEKPLVPRRRRSITPAATEFAAAARS